MILTEVVIRPTEKPRSVGPHKSILKKNGNKRKPRQENKKFRSVCKPTYGATADHNINIDLKSSRHLLCKSKDKDIYPHRNTNTLFPICWKFTKKRSRLIRDMLIYGRRPYYGHIHSIAMINDSRSILDKDKRLISDLVERLVFTNRITVRNIHDCVSYIIHL